MKAFVTLPGFVNDETSDSEDDDSEDDGCEFVNLSSEEVSFTHHSCFAHVLQLVVKDGLQNAGQINTVIKKCSKLVYFIRKSTIASDVLCDEIRPQADNITRWNSQLKMVKSVFSILENKLSELEGAPNLTTYDRNILQDIVTILTPFEEATEFVQVGCVPSAGYVLPCAVGLAHHLRVTTSRYNSAFFRGLKASLDRRMPYYERNETYILATILDPRFKLRWCNDEDEKKSV